MSGDTAVKTAIKCCASALTLPLVDVYISTGSERTCIKTHCSAVVKLDPNTKTIKQEVVVNILRL